MRRLINRWNCLWHFQVNNSPYDQGWMVKVKVGNKAEVDKLMDAGKYREFQDAH